MSEHDLVIREVDRTDCERLGTFLEENDIPEVSRYFHPFPLSRASACRIACTGQQQVTSPSFEMRWKAISAVYCNMRPFPISWR